MSSVAPPETAASPAPVLSRAQARSRALRARPHGLQLCDALASPAGAAQPRSCHALAIQASNPGQCGASSALLSWRYRHCETPAGRIASPSAAPLALQAAGRSCNSAGPRRRPLAAPSWRQKGLISLHSCSQAPRCREPTGPARPLSTNRSSRITPSCSLTPWIDGHCQLQAPAARCDL